MLFIGGYYGKSFVSKGVKFFTWGAISHVSLIKDSGETIQSWHNGGVALCKTPWDLHTKKTKIQLFKIECSVDLESIIWNKALNEIGMDYDISALFGFIPLLRKWHKNNINKWFCSELLSYVCNVQSFKLFNSTVPHYKIDPTYLCSSPVLSPIGYAENINAFNFIVENYTQNK